jgi:hypothetical protein
MLESAESLRLQDFVLACLRSRLGLGDLPDLAALTAHPGFDPFSLVDYARAQRVAPLLHRILGTLPELPAPVAQGLQQAYLTTAQANLYLMHEFSKVLQGFNHGGVHAVVGKGPLLVEQVYHDPALRPFSDLDVFVHPAEVPAAMDCLRTIGFQSVIEPYAGQALEFEKELLFTRPGILEVQVDLHWVLFGPTYYHLYQVPQDWLWSLTLPTQVAGVPVQTWSLEIQVVHLASHLILDHSGSPTLLWWYDLAALVQQPQEQIAWDKVMEYTRRLQVILPVRQCLHGLSTVWAVPIPQAVLDELHALQPSPAEARAYRWHTQPGLSHAHRALETLRALPGNRLRLKYFLLRLFPSPAYIRRILPHITSPVLLYPAYWLRGLRLVLALLKNR